MTFVGMENITTGWERKEIKISELNDSDLIDICNELYEYRNGKDIDNNSKIHKMFRENNDRFDIQEFTDDILDESAKRYSIMVKLLLLKRPYMFIK